MKDSPSYDVFISHSSRDKSKVRRLAHRLKADGVRVWLDEWIIRPGDMIGLKIEEGLESSRTLILVISEKAIASEWVKLERHTVLFRDPVNADRRFIPLLLDDCEIPATLRQFAYVDWRQESNEEYARLLAVCRAPATAPEEPSSPKPARVLTAHKRSVWGVGITAEGDLFVSASKNKTLRLWDRHGKTLATLLGHRKRVTCVSVTGDGFRAISGSDDRTVRVWDLKTLRNIRTLEGHVEPIKGVSINSDGSYAVSGSSDCSVKLWDLNSGICLATLTGHTQAVISVAISSDGRRAISGSADSTLRVWDLASQACSAVLEHKQSVLAVAMTADGSRSISGSADGTIRVWDLNAGTCVSTFEGHTQSVLAVALTSDGKRAVSGSQDETMRLWDVGSGRCLRVFHDHTNSVSGVAITADGRLAVSGSHDRTLRVWDLPDPSFDSFGVDQITRYTNAKVLLVGDSGVGKTGLAMRLAEGKFEPTISSDAVWATQLRLPRRAQEDNIEREIWLWDFAGQSDYRLIHQLYMDETALAVLVFNPQSENPFEGLGQWDRDLRRAARGPFRKLLVAARCDRGGLMVSRKVIDEFVVERHFSDFLQTSAFTGAGCTELLERIITKIDWEGIPWTASPDTFKILKEEIISLKDEGKVLLRIAELKQQLEMRLPSESFALDELRAVIGLLAGPGVVWKLEFGDFILLQPEIINSYAAAVIRTVRAHTDEIGCVAEEQLLLGDLDYQDVKRLSTSEEQIVLRAMHQTFVDHRICMREHSDAGTLLVFPSYFKRERPELEDHPSIFVTYEFNGALDEIYATLIVKLHHTPVFEKDRLWRFAADFRTPSGRRVGLKMRKKTEGAADLTVYFDSDIPDDTKVTFIRYVHEHLRSKDPNVIRVRHYVCPNPECNEPVEGTRAVRRAIQLGEKDIPCQFCRRPIPLGDLIEEKFNSNEFGRRVRELEKQAGNRIDNESRELILIGHAFSIAGEAGQIFRPTPNSGWGIDGEIEFKNSLGEPSGQRIFLQLKSDDSPLVMRQAYGKEVFTVRSSRYVEYWKAHRYPVMLVIRSSDGNVRWMNVTDYLIDKSRHTTSSLLFTEDDLRDSRGLVVKLADVNDALSRHILSYFADETKELIKRSVTGRSIPERLEKILITELNSVLKTPSFFDERYFSVSSEEIRQISKRRMSNEELLTLNRLLLEESYPEQLGKREEKHIVFDGEPFTALSVLRIRDDLIRNRQLN